MRTLSLQELTTVAGATRCHKPVKIKKPKCVKLPKPKCYSPCKPPVTTPDPDPIPEEPAPAG